MGGFRSRMMILPHTVTSEFKCYWDSVPLHTSSAVSGHAVAIEEILIDLLTIDKPV